MPFKTICHGKIQPLALLCQAKYHVQQNGPISEVQRCVQKGSAVDLESTSLLSSFFNLELSVFEEQILTAYLDSEK